MVIVLKLVKETKNTFQYKTDVVDAAVNTVYITKKGATELGDPKAITVTIAAAK